VAARTLKRRSKKNLLALERKRNRKRRRKNYRGPKGTPRVTDHAASMGKPPKTPPPKPPVNPPPNPGPAGPPPVFGRDFGQPELKRLLWRAGFGPRPGEVDALAGRPLQEVVHSLTRPQGSPAFNGPEPRTDDGPIAPLDAWGHDHLWWLDRMVRSDQPLVERMTLIWHDWFATSNDDVGSSRLMIDQNETLRANALGSFKTMLEKVTVDPAMLVFLNGVDNRRNAINENYARELMELFALGAGRGYTETDVRELAKCLTGWRANWTDGIGWNTFRFDPNRFQNTNKTVFGKTGNWGWQDAVRLVLENEYHASFFVTKLWSYFVPTPPDSTTQAALQQLYLSSNYGIRPVVEAILMHPDFYNGGAMVKPPVVYNAGLLRATGRPIDDDSWVWLGSMAGQQLFHPPNVSGWDDSAWLDTSRWRARWWIANYVLMPTIHNPWEGAPYDPNEDAAWALNKALGALHNPTLTSETRQTLAEFSSTCLPGSMREWQKSPYRAMRFNALRQLVATCPDYQTS
jgi:hypothetical protein